MDPRVGPDVEKGNIHEDSGLLGCDTVSFSQWLPTSGSSRRILACLTLKIKAPQSFEVLGTACTVTWRYIPEDVICSTTQNLKWGRKTLLVLRLLHGLSVVESRVVKCIEADCQPGF